MLAACYAEKKTRFSNSGSVVAQGVGASESQLYDAGWNPGLGATASRFWASHVPLSSSSTSWFWQISGDALRSREGNRSLAESNGSRPTPGSLTLTIIITTTIFIVLSSWPGDCESSFGSSGECRAAPSGRRPSDQATWLGLWVRLF